MNNEKAIGVFDSGVGGLTVLQALQQACPSENFIYLGDMARLPYGTKSPETVERYARQVTHCLLDRGIKCLVVACNTAATIALESLQREFPEIPVIGVLAPSAQAAVEQTQRNCVAVLATEATVNAKGYQHAIQCLNPEIEVVAQPAGLLVALAEEGWVSGPIVEGILQEYLEPLIAKSHADCLLLGCTHFPILMPAISQVVSRDMHIIDSASVTAKAVKSLLENKGLSYDRGGQTQYLVTDCPQRFVKVAKYFLNQPLTLNDVETVDSSLC